MKINMEENKLVQLLACFAFLALVLGAEFLIYKYQNHDTSEYIKKADKITVKRKNVQERATVQLKEVSVDVDVARRMRAVHREKAVGRATPQAVEPPTWAQRLVKTVEQNNPELHSVALLDVDGTILAHTDARRLYINLSDKLFFKDAMRGEASSEVMYSEQPQVLLRVIAVPIRFNGRVVGVLCAAVDISN